MQRMREHWTAAGAVVAGLAVAAGAFGAHLLRGTLSESALASWDTAARYQMYHGIALVIAGHRLVHRPGPVLRGACRFFALGIVLFSGSLYGLALTGNGVFGPITPMGGLALLAGWGCLAWALLHPAAPAA